jgi:hypothetical protein
MFTHITNFISSTFLTALTIMVHPMTQLVALALFFCLDLFLKRKDIEPYEEDTTIDFSTD